MTDHSRPDLTSKEDTHCLEGDLLSSTETLEQSANHELALWLKSAYQPEELDSDRGEALLQAALSAVDSEDDPDAPVSHEELAEAERLRSALEHNQEHPLATLAVALKVAHHPAPLPGDLQERLVAQALPSRTGKLLRFGPRVILGLALAAGFALIIRNREQNDAGLNFGNHRTATASTGPIRSRSSASLFHQRFELGETSARVDRIASARGHDLRENRYAAWGVR